MDNPVVTVIIPAFNQAARVGKAIKSVVEQDYENKQLCLIDPGSMDDTSDAILTLFTKFDSPTSGEIQGVKAFFLKKELKGPSAARNECIKFMWDKTHFFSMLDADDYYKPEKLTKTVNKMVADPNRIGLVYNDLEIYHESNGLRIREFRQSYNRVVLERENIITNSPLINKLALSKVGLYDENLRVCEDWDLWLRITEQFFAVQIPEALSVYSVTGENTTVSVNQEVWNHSWYTVQEKLRQRNS